MSSVSLSHFVCLPCQRYQRDCDICGDCGTTMIHGTFCTICGECETVQGFEECKGCLVESIASNPEEIETIGPSARDKVLSWVKAAYPDKTVAPVVIRFDAKQAS